MLPLGRQTNTQDTLEDAIKALRDNFLTKGATIEAFETLLCEVTGAQHTIACSNGSAALHMAALAAGIGPGDFVIVPAITFLGTANAILMAGAEVVFADVDPTNGLLTPQTLTAALHRVPNGRAKAVVAVHYAGQVCDMRGIAQVARLNNMLIIEDAAQALGSTYGRYGLDKAGDSKFSDLTTFSFHPFIGQPAIEGSAVTTNTSEFADRIRHLRHHGLEQDAASFKMRNQAFESDGTPKPWYQEITALGYNYRLSDLHASLCLAQLKASDEQTVKRKDLVANYKQNLAALHPLVRTIPQPWYTNPAWSFMVVFIDWTAIDKTRTEIMLALKDKDIQTDVHYMPVYRQPYYRRQRGNVTLGGAESFYERCLSLPLAPTMTQDDVSFVCNTLKNIIQKAS